MRGLWILALPAGLLAQNIITTVAGTDVSFPPPPLQAVDAPLGAPGGLVLDSKGNLLIADTDADLVIRVASNGSAEVAAGTGIPAFTVDIGENIPATRATLAGLRDIAADAAGNVYVLNNGIIRKIAANGTISTLVGEGVTAGAIPTASRILPDNSGGLYVLETFQHRIRHVSPGTLTVVAGTGEPGFSGDNGPANRAALRSPAGIALDSSGNLYVADSGNGRLRVIDKGGVIRTVSSGNAAAGGELLAVAVEPSGGVLFGGRWLRRLNRDGSITVLINQSPPGFSGDGGPALDAAVTAITGIAASQTGEIYLSDTVNRRVRRIDGAGRISTYAGSGIFRLSGDGGPASAALFSSPAKLTADAAGNIYVADFGNRRYRKIAVNGNVETLAGYGINNVTADSGPAPLAPFAEVNGIAVDARGLVYMTDRRSHRVRRLGTDGRVTTVAGNGNTSVLEDPVALAIGPDGSLFIGENQGNRVRRVLPDGTIRAFAGTGTVGNSGDGGQAAVAQIENVVDLAVDRAGVVYISTAGTVENNRASRIRAVATNGVIRTIAGTQQFPLDSGGVYLTIGPDQAMYFTSGCAVYRLTASGQVERASGLPIQCSSEGDGTAAGSATLAGPKGLAFDGQGNLVIAESLSHRIRKILAQRPSVSVNTQTLGFAAGARGPAPAPQSFTLSGSITNIPFDVKVDDGGRGWLIVEDLKGVTPRIIDVTVDPERVGQGTYEGTIRIETPNAVPAVSTVRVRFEAGPPLPPAMQSDRPSVTFAYPREPVARREVLMLSNSGSGVIPLSIGARTANGGSWLQTRPAQGLITPRAPLQVTVQADPAGLAPGTYTGAVVLSAGNQVREIPVTMMISEAEHAILLSQTGLSFTAVRTGGQPPPQDFAVVNIGSGSMPFQASASTLSGGDWLLVTPTEGSSVAGSAAPLIQVSVNHAGLEPGRYYGQVRIDSPAAANSPHAVTVNLEVLPPTENPGAVIQPAELSFEPTAGGAPGAKEVSIYNLTPNAVSFRSRAFDSAVLPRDAVVEPHKPLRMIVQPTTLSEQGRKSAIFLQFSDGILRGLPIFLRADQTSEAAAKPGMRSAASCTPKSLVPSMVSLGQASTVPAGWPAALSVEVKDDCGAPMDEGNVTVSFSNGDPPVSLQSLRDGRWQGTWQSRSASAARVVLRVEAEQPAPSIRGARDVSADLRPSQDPPSISPDGVVSASSNVPFAPQAQGGLVSINGERFTDNVTQNSNTAPWPSQLGGTEVLVGARRIPLGLASPGQLTGILPGDVAPNTTHQILIRRGSSYSRPVAVNVAAAQPGIFTNTGSKQAIATVVRGDERQANGAAFPARSGDTLIVMCSGLGVTDPAVIAGEAAPDGARVVAPVSAKIGSTAATVSSAVLAPGLVGTYQVTITVPDGVETGDAVPLVIDAGGQTSPAATLVLRAN